MDTLVHQNIEFGLPQGLINKTLLAGRSMAVVTMPVIESVKDWLAVPVGCRGGHPSGERQRSSGCHLLEITDDQQSKSFAVVILRRGFARRAQ